jgi:hypothetical protein
MPAESAMLMSTQVASAPMPLAPMEAPPIVTSTKLPVTAGAASYF